MFYFQLAFKFKQIKFIPLKNSTFIKISFNILFLIVFSGTLSAQNKYWVQFSDEWCGTNENIACELPLEWYNFLSNHEEVQMHFQSKWLNLVSATIPEFLLKEANSIAYIQSITPIQQLLPLNISAEEKEYSYALEQIKAQYLTDSLHLTGRNIKIGVIDGGFMKADKDPALQDMVENDQVVYFKDYLMSGNEDPFYGRKIFSDDHGTDVLKMIAGNNPSLGMQYGMATKANFYLARTDHGIREQRVEEDYWISALESFYEMDIRLVNSSLGYSDGFDKRKENHTTKEVDGKSSIITRAAQKAAEKGMLLVIAAGNEGGKKWEILSLPADAKDVLSVGSVRFDEWTKVYYSSIGSKKLDYVKPDVVCFASNGTSFSAPVITGLAACIWEYDSTLSNYQVMDIIKQSAHLYEAPNTHLGYGVPDSEKIVKLLKNSTLPLKIQKVQQKGNTYKFEWSGEMNELVIFHKKNKTTVNSEETAELKSGENTLIIERKDNTDFTTLVNRDRILIEIEWVK